MADFLTISRPARSARRGRLSDATARAVTAYAVFAAAFGFTLAVVVGLVH